MTFRVGQKVVCVRASGAPELRLGGIYTIEHIEECLADGLAGLDLHEVRPPGYPRYAYYADRFRPIVERKTDISIFTAMLTPKKTRVRA